MGDDAGYLINSPTGAGGDASLLTRTFVGSFSNQLAQFASGMIESALMSMSYCLDYSLLKRQSYYDVRDTGGSGVSSCGGVSYTVTPVPGSAFYLVVLEDLTSTASNCCASTCPTTLSATSCETPCRANLTLDNQCRSFSPSSAEINIIACPEAAPVLRSAMNPSGSDSGLSTGAIVGIAIGAAAAVALIVIIIVVVVVKKRGQAHGAASNAVAMQAPPMASEEIPAEVLQAAASEPPPPAKASAPPLAAL